MSYRTARKCRFTKLPTDIKIKVDDNNIKDAIGETAPLLVHIGEDAPYEGSLF